MTNLDANYGDNAAADASDTVTPDFPEGFIHGLGHVTAVDDNNGERDLNSFAEVSGDLAAMLAEQYLDAHRFETCEDAILARHGDDSGALYPSTEVLERTGIDLVGLAAAMQTWLTPERVVDFIDTFRTN